MFSKILVAIDDSAMSRPVFEAGLFLAQATGSAMKMIYVISPDRASIHDAKSQAAYLQPYPAKSERQLNCYLGHLELPDQDPLREYTDRATVAGIQATFVSCFGVPGSTICEVAHNWKADLIVLGRRGLPEHTEQQLGSVSSYVLHHAPCTVHVIQRPVYVDIEIPVVEHAK
jgi:nucleotide-binding universal stress UspA family protein